MEGVIEVEEGTIQDIIIETIIIVITIIAIMGEEEDEEKEVEEEEGEEGEEGSAWARIRENDIDSSDAMV